MRMRMQWTKRLGRLYRGKMSARDEHMKMGQAFVECAGQWVAVDRKTGDVVAANSSPYELSAYIKSAGIHSVDIVRAPAEQEPEMVGFG
jgi:hypothetical protein